MFHPMFPDIPLAPQLFSYGFHTRNANGNDAAVRLTRDSDSLTLWVDHEDPERREWGDIVSRYELYQHGEDGESIVIGSDKSFETLAELLAYLETL